MTFNRRSLMASFGAVGGASLLPVGAGTQTASIAAGGGDTTIFVARKIVTLQTAYPEAKAVAVRDGRILGVGQSVDDLSPWTGTGKVRIDSTFSNDVLMPGFIEPHIHPMQGAALLPAAFIAPDEWRLPRGTSPACRTPEQYRQRLKAALRDAPADRLFITWGYHELWHGEVTRKELDEMSPDRPVVVWQRSFHAIVFNTAAMRKLGLPMDSAALKAALQTGMNPAHADLERGVFSETTLAIGIGKLAPHLLAPAWIKAGFAELRAMLKASGVTTVSDMGTGIFADFETEAAMILKEFDAADAPQQVMLMPMAHQMIAKYGGGAATRAAMDAYADTHLKGTRVFMNNRVKLFADGAFFAQNMRMNAPGYTDGHVGKWLTEPDMLKAIAREYWNNGFNIHTHVNGDEGLDVVLDILAGLREAHPGLEQRFTLEHLGFSTDEQAARIARLGALVSAQPNYVYVLTEAYGKKGFGHDRADEISRLGALERLGVPVALHSDFNMAPPQPLFLAWIAANRQTMDGRVVAPTERLSLDAALRAITSSAAYVLGQERNIGTIAAGKRADFTALAADPHVVGAAGLKDIPVKGTVFGGRVFA